MTNAEMNPLLVRSNARLFAGMFITPLSILSIVVTLAFDTHPLFALFPMPTLIIGTAMVTLELRNRIEKQDAIIYRTGTTDDAKLQDRKLGFTMIENVDNH